MGSFSMRRALTGSALLALTLSMMTAAPAAGDPTPRGVHLAFGEDASTTVTASWFTAPGTGGSSIVEYGPTPSLGSSAVGSTKTAPGLAPTKATSLHEAMMSGLTPGAVTYYRVGDGSAWSEIRTFRSAASEGSFRFVAFGDHGTYPQSQITTPFVRALDPAFAIIAGDVSYANGDLERWDTWSEQIEPLASMIPLMPAPGNHDTDVNETPTPQAFIDRFALPDAELYYSFDYERVHFLVLHSTLRSGVPPAVVAQEMAFAEQDLAETARRRAEGEIDFIFVVQHHPLYGSQLAAFTPTYAERNYNPPLIAWEERLFHTYGVDVLIVGHNHHYERSFPMAAGLPTTAETTDYADPIGFIQVISGGAGAGLYDFKEESEIGLWSAVRQRRHHVMEFEVDGPILTARARATDGSGDILDTWTITRS